MSDGNLQVRWGMINEILDHQYPKPMSRGPAQALNQQVRDLELKRMGYETMPIEELEKHYRSTIR